MEKHEQTYVSFRDKWTKNRDLAFKETLRENSDIFNWILQRNGFTDSNALTNFLSAKTRILDAGCGNGRVTALLATHANPTTEIMGIDLTAAEVASENLKSYANVKVQSKDLLGDLSDLNKFDFIYCQEVLHHTRDPKQAFMNLCQRLDKNGEIAVYLYKQKAPIREFADDMIRNSISNLPYEKAIDVMQQITNFAKAMSEANIKVNVPDVQVLDIPAGEYDIQRLLYHFFFKCFWNPDMSYEENVVINYDWYHPQLCTRHTLNEILGWFEEAKLTVNHQFVDFYGITVRGQMVA